jgi:hypothetical protein
MKQYCDSCRSNKHGLPSANIPRDNKAANHQKKAKPIHKEYLVQMRQSNDLIPNAIVEAIGSIRINETIANEFTGDHVFSSFLFQFECTVDSLFTDFNALI